MKLQTCLICDRALIGDVTNILARGQRKLVWASTLRNDGKFQKVFDTPIQLHVRCRRSYVSDGCIASAAKKAARANVQVCYVETIPIERDHEEEEEQVLESCIQSEKRKHNCSDESVKDCCIKTAVLKRDPEVENISAGCIKSQEKNRYSQESDTIQSSTHISPLVDMGLPNGMPLNNQCYIEIEEEKKCSKGQNINELITKIAEKEGNCLDKNISKNHVESTTINSYSVGRNNSIFDYQKQCLFCTEDASEDFIRAQSRKPTKKRILVYKVRRETGDKILCYCLHYDSNDLSKEVRLRVENKDLIGLNARYHRLCYLKFLTLDKVTRGKRGRPPSEEIQNSMKLVYDYIDNYIEEGTEFSLSDIKRVLNLDLHERTMQSKLEKHYGEALYLDLPNNRIRKGKPEENNDDSEVPQLSQHSGFRCDVCLEDIIGFRYACVQCANCDLCGACEARGEHATHYVLRVPPNKPHVEVQALLDNMRNVLSPRDGDNGPEPVVNVEEPEPELCEKEDPLAAFPDDCHRDFSEEQTRTREESILTQNEGMEHSEMEDAATFSILTEPIGQHCGVALYTQFKSEKVNDESEKSSDSQAKAGLIGKESPKPSYTCINPGLYTEGTQTIGMGAWSDGQSQESLYSQFETKHTGEECQKLSYYSMPVSIKSPLLYAYLNTEPSNEETQKPTIRLGMGPWSGGQSQEASCSGVGSGGSMQIASSYMEPNRRLRRRRGQEQTSTKNCQKKIKRVTSTSA